MFGFDQGRHDDVDWSRASANLQPCELGRLGRVSLLEALEKTDTRRCF
jgi:hypothetical protein